MIYKFHTTKKILILGGSGVLGKHIRNLIKGNIVFTSNSHKKKYVFFNLDKTNINDILNGNHFTHTIIAINIKRISEFDNKNIRNKFNKKLINVLIILKKKKN